MKFKTSKEEILAFIAELKDLEKRTYIGHDIQLDIMDAKHALEKKITSALEDRILNILSICAALPEGDWNNERYSTVNTGIFAAIRTYSAFLRSTEENDPESSVKLWFNSFSESPDGAYYYYVCGDDDGYPEYGHISIPLSWMLIDDLEELRFRIYNDAYEEIRNSRWNLEDRRNRELENQMKVKNTIESFNGKFQNVPQLGNINERPEANGA